LEHQSGLPPRTRLHDVMECAAHAVVASAHFHLPVQQPDAGTTVRALGSWSIPA